PHPYVAAGEHDDVTSAQSLHPRTRPSSLRCRREPDDPVKRPARAPCIPPPPSANTTPALQPNQAIHPQPSTHPFTATGEHDGRHVSPIKSPSADPAAPNHTVMSARSKRGDLREHIDRVFVSYGGNITQAAALLGLHCRSLQRKLAKRPSP